MATSARQYPNNLPIALSSFIGRGREIVEVKQLLATNRLLTLIGAGGCGKTRLAIWVAEEVGAAFSDGVWLVELASLANPELAPQTLATVLGLREQTGRPVLESLTDHLASRQVLLVLDNCEHLIGACAQLAHDLLQRCPDLRILATSREPLSISGETVWLVPPLSTPEFVPESQAARSGSDLLRYEAVRLFVERASAVSPAFELTDQNAPTVAEICQRLDGIPLAIELAAARTRALSVRQIADRLDDRFHLLTGGSRIAPPRHQTLEATLDWSHTLLPEVERMVLHRLSVFAGGWTLEAAEAVCASDNVPAGDVLEALAHLADKSLVVVDQRGHDDESRYRLLETIRQYALKKLVESGEDVDTKNRHLSYFIQWAEAAEPHLTSREQLPWLNRYEAEHDNLRAALEWCLADEAKSQAGLRLAAACGRFWRMHGYASEGRARFAVALARPGAQAHTLARARALALCANLAYLQSDFPDMRPIAEEALLIGRGLGEKGKPWVAFTLDLLGELATEEGDYASAPALFQASLDIYRELGNTRGISDILMQFGWMAMRSGDYPQAIRHLEEFRALAQTSGDKSNLAFALSGLGEAAVRQGQYERAVVLLEQGLALNRERKDKWGTGTILGSLGWVALRQRDFERMRVHLGESLTVRIDVGDRGGIAWCLEKLAEAASLQGQFQQAAQLFGAAAALRAPIKSVIDPADQPDHEQSLAVLRARLGEESFVAAWAEGSAMTVEQAVAVALSEPDTAAPLATSLPDRSAKARFGGLTEREREVAALIAQGKANREIAEAMVVSVKTVETYVTRILNKLGFDSRVQIATWAVEKGLTTISATHSSA